MNAATALTWLLLLPMLAAPVIYLVGRIAVRRGAGNPARWLAVAALLATGYPLYFTAQAFSRAGAIELVVGSVALRFDGISLLVSAVVLGLGTLVALFSTTYMAGEANEEKYYALLTILIGTIVGLGCAGDLFNLWVWFEAMAISSYTLVAFYNTQPASLEAGVKYLVQSAAGSALVLLGVALVFSLTGQLDLLQIHSAVQGGSLAAAAAGGLLVIGFGVKTALVPVHTWLPDAHSQAPSGISAMLSGMVIEAGLIALLRSVAAISGATASWGGLLLAMGILNVVVGNLMALRQTQVKRLLAYSSLSHIGYMVLGLGVALGFNNLDGAAGSFFHLINHALMKGLAFLSAGALLYVLHVARGDHGPLVLDDLN
ncbi:MAG: hypothetical protein GYA17_05925, partial [Chloroflexi bacterium]|nr:hypothetical protein [Chloroflexota bacterium]